MTDTIQLDGINPSAITDLSAYTDSLFKIERASNNEQYAASGFVHFGKHYTSANSKPINQGLFTGTTVPNVLWLGARKNDPGLSKTANAILNVVGVIFELDNISYADFISHTRVKFPEAPDGTVTYDKATGITTKHVDADTAFTYANADTANREVVTERVDMWGFEMFKREITEDDPYVYPNGLIQSTLAAMNTVITTPDLIRPITYFAAFEGDTASRGKGVNWMLASHDDKEAILDNPKNNIVYDPFNHKWYQYCLRQRTIAGLGNGDWYVSDSATAIPNASLSAKNKPTTRVKVQGPADVPDEAVTSQFFSATASTFYNIDPQNGVFTSRRNVSSGEPVYFLVCGTVSRLNQGAYHPSFNPLGVSWAITNNGTNGGVWSRYPNVLTSKADCFDYYHATTNPTGKASSPEKGGIGGGQYGRPDSRAHNAIYEDGQGGVCRDMRYSANGVDLVDFDEADIEVKHGTYRGFENIPFSKVVVSDAVASNVQLISSTVIRVRADTFMDISQTNRKNILALYVEANDGTYFGSTNVTPTLTDGRFVDIHCDTTGFVVKATYDAKVVVTQKSDYSVGGSFLQTDLIGDPTNILKTAAFKNGWEGCWIPQVPNGVLKEWQLNRKSLSTTLYSVRDESNNGTWLVQGYSYNTSKNALVNYPYPNTAIVMLQYQATAKITEPANNEVVYGTLGGSTVWASSYNGVDSGGAFIESLLDKIPRDLLFDNWGRDLPLTALSFEKTGTLATSASRYIAHTPISFITPFNDSIAVKALGYNTVANYQGFKQYTATELKHNGRTWGDDSKMQIVSGESTKTDLNGNTVKVVTHKLKEPIGWIKNKV